MTIGLCLSGGGAKGDFELGAVRHLYDRGIRPQVIASTSVGSVNAVKLAEGEDPGDPGRGLAGLERLWESLSTNGDMYSEEPWLHDPGMDPRVRDALTGRASGLGISGPELQGGRWGDLDPLIDLVNGFSFLVSDGVALLKSLDVIATKARSLYNLSPISTLLFSRVNLGHVASWAAAGGRWRMAAVALESGRLRYITESGQVLERDGTPVTWAGPLTSACQALKDRVDDAEQDVLDRQADLRSAGPGQKGAVVARIRQAQAAQREARAAFAACVAAQPKVPLTVDIRQGVLASATMPAIFRTVPLGDETYVDGGVREILPVQIAVDLGADDVYAVSASPMTAAGQPPGTYTNAGMKDVLSRSMVELLLNEINLDDVRVQPRPGTPAPRVLIIAPDVEIHDVTTIDPGLIQINRDYGWMRAADVLDAIVNDSDRWRSATAIALTRLSTWRAENHRFGHEDPTRLADGTPPPDPSVQAQIDAGKARLGQLLGARRAAGGPVPAGIDRWASALELHPWSAALNDAAYVSQTVPARMIFGQATAVSVTMRNTGTTTWTEATGHRLGSQSPQDNTTWGSGRQVLPGPVPPGEQVTFSFPATVPRPPGASFQWRMVQENVEWFGATAPMVAVTVTESAECAQVRTAIQRATADIDALRQSLIGLDPKIPVERKEISTINAQIADEERQLNEQRTRSAALGCP